MLEPTEHSLHAAFLQHLLGLQPSDNLPNTLQKKLHRRQHLLLQQGDLFFGVGIVDPAALHRLPRLSCSTATTPPTGEAGCGS